VSAREELTLPRDIEELSAAFERPDAAGFAASLRPARFAGPEVSARSSGRPGQLLRDHGDVLAGRHLGQPGLGDQVAGNLRSYRERLLVDPVEVV
jgi:hypothetical protein